jgi:outer membrane murein-binding lipoprotein Lpp
MSFFDNVKRPAPNAPTASDLQAARTTKNALAKERLDHACTEAQLMRARAENAIIKSTADWQAVEHHSEQEHLRHGVIFGLDNVSEKVETATSSIKHRIQTDADESITRHHQTLTEHQATQNKVDQGFNELLMPMRIRSVEDHARLQAMEPVLNGVDAKTSEISTKIGDIDTRMSGIETNIDAMASSVTDTRTAAEEVREEMRSKGEAIELQLTGL